jgi:hypothetical protein
MPTPLEHYQPVDFAPRKDEDLKRGPEKYFWGAIQISVGVILIGGFVYPTRLPYSGAVPGVIIGSFLALIVTAILRKISHRATPPGN